MCLRQQAIVRNNVDQDLYRHIVSLGRNELSLERSEISNKRVFQPIINIREIVLILRWKSTWNHFWIISFYPF